MIQDKDYVMRLVRQLSNFLSKLLLGKREKEWENAEQILDTQLRDVFNLDFNALNQLSTVEILEKIHLHKKEHHTGLYELMGHLFYFKYQEDAQPSKAEKAHYFYTLWLNESQIYAQTILNRINELKEILT